LWNLGKLVKLGKFGKWYIGKSEKIKGKQWALGKIEGSGTSRKLGKPVKLSKLKGN
jgi:hypothetical protein